MKFFKYTLVVLFFLLTANSIAQISPGELSVFHIQLEGISNCTQCHILGQQLSNDKCLACHTELKERIVTNKGYHASVAVKGKTCATCHSDHQGRSFQIVKFDIENFNHTVTGFLLTGAHSKKTCTDCHNTKLIASSKIKEKKFTFLGLQTNCINCHTDYHQRTLSSNCLNCHDGNSFKPASKFNHKNAKFQLGGKHITVDCIKCHKIEITNGIKFQKFTGLQFSNCIDCHIDPHKNKFGPNCNGCHSDESFVLTKEIKGFDHTKTNYPLEGQHQSLTCKTCHKINYSTHLKYQKCIDCHVDYHDGQFVKAGIAPDCSSCHDVNGYKNSSYNIERHNESTFVLEGAHTTIACIDCHRKTEKWVFRGVGKKCSDCHPNFHGDAINKKYYPDNNCLICHNTNSWNWINFDHRTTNFKLEGTHNTLTCRKCHFTENSDGTIQQKFAGLSVNCTGCHADKHFGQFDINSITDCMRCHRNDTWKPVKFDHNQTAFKLNGKHENLECNKCHKPTLINNNNYIIYKISVKCESCHS